jgi:glycosyltransferase involved in cell wall biosynthesis
MNGGTLRKELDQLAPDLLHAHYASGYATLARFSQFRPLVVSVWGSDVFDFPRKSLLHRRLIQRNLRHADCICSTSHVMADQCHHLYSDLRDIRVISFGVDTNLFRSEQRCDTDTITIGTVKVLAPKYGMDTLLRGFTLANEGLLKDRQAIANQMRLRIVGDGPQRRELEQLSRDLGIADVTTFVGRVSHHEVPQELKQLDVYVAVSRLDSESFGVAIIEAAACELPVIVSDTGGLPEVVLDGQTGHVVARESLRELASSLRQLMLNPEQRKDFGKNGRKHVVANYDWHKDVAAMADVYDSVAGRVRNKVLQAA